MLKQFTRHINTCSSKVWSWIFESYGGWIYDDGNETDLPQGATDLASGTSKYALPSEALTVNRIEVMDSAGNYVKLTPITQEMIASGIDEFQSTDGTPQGYRLIGNTVELFPAPSYNSTGGLKVYFDREAVAFASTDTTKAPGFASPYHNALAVGASLEWMKIKQPDHATIVHLKEDWARYERDIRQFYTERWKDYKPRMKRAKVNWR